MKKNSPQILSDYPIIVILSSLYHYHHDTLCHLEILYCLRGRRQVLLKLVELVSVLDMCMSGFQRILTNLSESETVLWFHTFGKALTNAYWGNLILAEAKFLKLAQKTLGKIGSIAKAQLWEFLQSYLYCHCVSSVYRCHDHHCQTRLDQSCD